MYLRTLCYQCYQLFWFNKYRTQFSKKKFKIYAYLKTNLRHYDNHTNSLNIVNITKYINVGLNIDKYIMLCN